MKGHTQEKILECDFFFLISELSLAIHAFVNFVGYFAVWWSSTPTLQAVCTADAELKNVQTSLPPLLGVWERSLPSPFPVWVCFSLVIFESLGDISGVAAGLKAAQLICEGC